MAERLDYLDENPESGGEDQFNKRTISAYSTRRMDQFKQMAAFPPDIKKRIQALRKLQLQTTYLEAEFHKKVYELEKQFERQHNEIFQKRNQIINGDYEPSEEESSNDPELSPQLLQIMEDLSLNREISIPYGLNANKGIPNFWVTVLKSIPEPFVKPCDEPALEHLLDVRAISKLEPSLSFVLEFHFSPNPYFTDSVLTKTYYLKCDPEGENPFSFDGPEIYKCEGCQIHWNEGKNLTLKTVKKKRPNTDHTPRVIRVESFFNFFDPPECPEDENDPLFDDLNSILETDFEIGHYLKERVIPRAVLFFTGESEDLSQSNSSVDNSASEECAAISDEDLPEAGNGNNGDGFQI